MYADVWDGDFDGGLQHTCAPKGPPANNKARCGEVDAAPRIPADLFELRNIGKLSLYISITINSYSNLLINNPTWAPDTKLELGRCRGKGYTDETGGVQGINWVNQGLMGPICKAQCDCNYPACKDEPDDPSAGKFCSLCGPKYVTLMPHPLRLFVLG